MKIIPFLSLLIAVTFFYSNSNAQPNPMEYPSADGFHRAGDGGIAPDFTLTDIRHELHELTPKSGIAPNFTLTDIGGTPHTLYDYLDINKAVILEFYAVWCVPAQNNASAIENVWLAHGPSGDSTVMVLGLETDPTSTNAEVSNYASTYSCTYPQINNTGLVPVEYQIPGLPTYLVVCPDRTYSQVFGDSATIEGNLNTAISSCTQVSTTLNDVKALDFDAPLGSFCSDSITPIVTIQNYGQNTLTSADIISKIDGTPYNTFNWTGSLARYMTEQVNLPTISSISNGAHTFTFETANPNGFADDDTSNDAANSDFIIILDGEQIEVKITTDIDPFQTSWEITDVTYTYGLGGNYSDDEHLYTHLVCVEEGKCYTFTIFDTYGDGMTVVGKVEISYNDSTILFFTGSDFSGFSKDFNFCVPDFSSINEVSISRSFVIFPNPSRGKFTLHFTSENTDDIEIIITNVLGKVIAVKKYKPDVVTNYAERENIKFDLSSFANGVYYLTVYTSSYIRTEKIVKIEK